MYNGFLKKSSAFYKVEYRALTFVKIINVAGIVFGNVFTLPSHLMKDNRPRYKSEKSYFYAAGQHEILTFFSLL